MLNYMLLNSIRPQEFLIVHWIHVKVINVADRVGYYILVFDSEKRARCYDINKNAYL